MKIEDKKIWDDDSPVYVTWLDYILDLIIITVVIAVLFCGVCVASAKGRDYGPRAGVTVALSKTYVKAERQARKKAKERAALEEKEKAQNDIYEEVFGYVPSDDEIVLFKRIVMAECGNTEPDDGILAVCYTIANRVRSDRFPNTITGVAYQKNQFETVATGRIYRYEVNERVEAAFERLLKKERWSDFSMIFFFTAGGYNPYGSRMFVIGNHYFGGLRS